MEGLWLEGRVSGEEGGKIGCEWCHGGMGVFGEVVLWEKLKLEAPAAMFVDVRVW